MMTPQDKNKIWSIRMSESEYEKLAAIAEQTGKTKAGLIRFSLMAVCDPSDVICKCFRDYLIVRDVGSSMRQHALQQIIQTAQAEIKAVKS